MKDTKKLLRLAMILISITWIFQSCNIYRKQPITLDQAVEGNYNVKVVFMNDKKMQFDKVEIKDEVIYGLKKLRDIKPKRLFH